MRSLPPSPSLIMLSGEIGQWGKGSLAPLSEEYPRPPAPQPPGTLTALYSGALGLGSRHPPASSVVTDKDTPLVSDSFCGTECKYSALLLSRAGGRSGQPGGRWRCDRNSAPPAFAVPPPSQHSALGEGPFCAESGWRRKAMHFRAC